MPVAMRRPHQKTKTGCLQCRQRRIKCDEKKPDCSYCQRHSSRCTYTTSSSGPSIASTPVPESASSYSSPNAYPQLQLSPTGSDMSWGDFELLHHFTTATSRTISRNPKHQTMWEISVPQLALDQPFLMRGIFAISALHLAYLRPHRREEYIVVATKHEYTALQAYRSVLQNINSDNCHAIFAFSSLVIVYSLGSPVESGSLLFAGADTSEALPEWLHLLRGTYAILSSVWSWIEAGSMAPLIEPNYQGMQRPEDDSEAENFLKLASMLEPTMEVSCQKQENFDICKAALDALKLAFKESYRTESKEHCRRLASYRWPCKISEDFLVLLSRREPEPLILLAHECVLMAREEPCWYMEGHVTRLISVIKNSLDEQWLPYIEWPLKEIEKRMT